MTASDVCKRIAARCTNCRSIFAAELAADGTIRPLGVRRGCPCGDGEFRVMG